VILRKYLFFFLCVSSLLFSQKHYVDTVSFVPIYPYEEALLKDVWAAQHKLIVLDKQIQEKLEKQRLIKYDLFCSELAFIRTRVETFERQLKGLKRKETIGKDIKLFLHERLVLGEIIEEEPELAVPAQEVLDKTLRLVTLVHQSND
jgi:hypothetical protein